MIEKCFILAKTIEVTEEGRGDGRINGPLSIWISILILILLDFQITLPVNLYEMILFLLT